MNVCFAEERKYVDPCDKNSFFYIYDELSKELNKQDDDNLFNEIQEKDEKSDNLAEVNSSATEEANMFGHPNEDTQSGLPTPAF